MAKKQQLLIAFFSLLAFSPSKTEGGPALSDSEYERRIYNIYLKHYKNPISHSDWNNKIQSLPKRRELKFRDNLWDLSGAFFQDHLYWSKIWAANPQVENPHKIYQGDFIKLDPLTLANVNASEHSVDIQDQFPGLIVPENEGAKKALSEEDIPSSLPRLLSPSHFAAEIDISQLQTPEIEMRAVLPFYLSDDPPASAGTVISKDGYGLAANFSGERLVVQINSAVSIGAIFTVFENKGRAAGLFQYLAGLNESEIMIKGQIKILAQLTEGDPIYLAETIEAGKSILPGDDLLEGKAPLYSLSHEGPKGTVNGKIIGSAQKDKSLLSAGDLVYLNKGTNDGLSPGELFYIRGDRAKREKVFERPYKYDQPVLGRLKIARSSTHFSTALILSARDQIYKGDIFSGSAGSLTDLSQSLDYEEVDEPDSEPGKELMIDFEEAEEEEESEEDMEEADLDEEFEEEAEEEEADLDEELEEEFEEEEEDIGDEELEEELEEFEELDSL